MRIVLVFAILIPLAAFMPHPAAARVDPCPDYVGGCCAGPCYALHACSEITQPTVCAGDWLCVGGGSIDNVCVADPCYNAAVCEMDTGAVLARAAPLLA